MAQSVVSHGEQNTYQYQDIWGAKHPISPAGPRGEAPCHAPITTLKAPPNQLTCISKQGPICDSSEELTSHALPLPVAPLGTRRSGAHAASGTITHHYWRYHGGA